MKIASLTENLNVEKRIAITPEIAKKYKSLGFEVLISKDYGSHLGFENDHYKSQGYATYDVSNQRKIGYDIKCEKPGSTRYVEVKGTQTDGWCVFVTKNEVEKAKSEPRDLFIVKNIQHRYDIEEHEYRCEGGEVKIISPWKPYSSKSSLTAIEYKFCP